MAIVAEDSAVPALMAVELSIVVPTYNERENVRLLVRSLEAALEGITWEVIFVDDDSPDGTADLLREIARGEPRVRVIRRLGRRGLASACVQGVLSSSAPYFAVMDADMQHDETILPEMLEQLKTSDLDLVVGSRYVDGGNVSGWDSRRQLISRIASRAARLVIKSDLKDPMSGYFLMRRKAFDETARSLSLQGFKILVDLFASAPKPLRFSEVPYQFRARNYGESKLDSMAAWEYGMLLGHKLFGGLIPPRFILFGLIGTLGLIVHIWVLGLSLSAGLSFTLAQTTGVLSGMTFNFTLNNMITYCDQRLRGWEWLRGLLTFYAICSIGAVANVGIGTFIYAERPVWWLAGLAGALVGAVWNYAVTGLFTWRGR
jgi:dolichol-phosphate mannosyltransferase